MRCEQGHTQTLLTPDHSKEQAEMLAGLMDGTSRFYVLKPTAESFMGRCATCKTRFTSKLFGFSEKRCQACAGELLPCLPCSTAEKAR